MPSPQTHMVCWRLRKARTRYQGTIEVQTGKDPGTQLQIRKVYIGRIETKMGKGPGYHTLEANRVCAKGPEDCVWDQTALGQNKSCHSYVKERPVYLGREGPSPIYLNYSINSNFNLLSFVNKSFIQFSRPTRQENLFLHYLSIHALSEYIMFIDIYYLHVIHTCIHACAYL